MKQLTALARDGGDHENTHLFETIARDISKQGYSINQSALPPELAQGLLHTIIGMPEREFDVAGVGRKQDHVLNQFVRSDEICWITGETPACAQWLRWTGDLQTYLNRRLFLGLFSFESHFAHYAPGDFYKKHYDAFRGQANRVLSVVVYLNSGWQAGDAGELVLYTNDDDQSGIKVLPTFGTMVVFLSEEFPHEVLPANRDRYSIAGWFRVNTSHAAKVDPPA